MRALGVLPPSIEPHASGHIIEQEELVSQIMDNGYAYESNGSVYFDVEKYNRDHRYGILSGRNLDDVKDASRELDGVGEKRHQVDFALWKKRAAGAHHALAKPLERRIPGLALRVHGHGQEVPRAGVRHTRRRHGPRLPPPRVRDSAGRGRSGQAHGALLDAQQHDNHQRAEDGQEPRQLHNARAVLHRRPRKPAEALTRP